MKSPMRDFRREIDMRQPVCDWLRSRGFLPAVEFFLWHTADIVAGRYGERPAARRKPPLLQTVAVELKIRDVAGVIGQAGSNADLTDQSFCAMPAARCAKMRPGTAERFRVAGVGLLSVGDEIREIIEPSVGLGTTRMRKER